METLLKNIIAVERLKWNNYRNAFLRAVTVLTICIFICIGLNDRVYAENANDDILNEIQADVYDPNLAPYCVLIDDNATIEAYYPEPVKIYGYNEFDCPVDENGNQIMYTWGYSEHEKMYRYYDVDGYAVRAMNTNPYADCKAGGMGRVVIYMTYPDAMSDMVYEDTYLYFHMIHAGTMLEYAIKVPYGERQAEIRMPCGLYYNCYVSASSNLSLPADAFFTGTAYVGLNAFAHMDFYANETYLAEETVVKQQETLPYHAIIEYGTNVADETEFVTQAEELQQDDLIPVTGGGLLDELIAGNDANTETESINESLSILTLVAGVAFVCFGAILLFAIIVMRKKEKRRKG